MVQSTREKKMVVRLTDGERIASIALAKKLRRNQSSMWRHLLHSACKSAGIPLDEKVNVSITIN